MPELVLYSSTGSPFGRKVQVTLEMKGLTYRYEEIDPYNTPLDFESLSPAGRVPVLLDPAKAVGGDSGTIADSSAICVYLEAIASEPQLYPEDPFERARAVWFEELADVDMEVPIGLAWHYVAHPRFRGADARIEDAQKAWAKYAASRLDYLDSALGAGPYFVGNSVTIADIAIACAITQLDLATGSTQLDRWPALSRHYDRMREQPAFDRVLGWHRDGLSAWLPVACQLDT